MKYNHSNEVEVFVKVRHMLNTCPNAMFNSNRFIAFAVPKDWC